MNNKRFFFKKIFFFAILTFFPYQLNKSLKIKKNFLKKKFSKIWILSSDDI